MCGIAGIVTKKKLKKNKIDQLISLMKNRGPDGQRFIKICNNKLNYYLFFSRLSILDLNERSMQPFKYKNLILIFNGEIYNYLEIKEDLKSLGYKFSTSSDTEVLIKAWDKWGEKCLNKLDGMWSFAILNTKTFKLFLSRDIFGEKPLYYSLSNNNLIFGSQINFISCLNDFKLNINYNKVKQFLFNGYKSINYDNKSFFKNITKINSSEILTFNSDLALNKKKYYQLKNYKKTRMSENELLENLFNEIKNSMKIRLRSDVEKSFLLSGGIDSNSLICMSKKLFEEKINSFSILSSSKYHNENKFIKIGSDQCDNTTYVNLKNSDNSIKENYEKMQNFHFAPIPTLTSALTFSLGKIIKEKKIKVVYTGLGGDELFSGYLKHYIYFLGSLKRIKENKFYFNSWEKNIKNFVHNPYLKSFKYLNQNYINKYAFNYKAAKKYFFNYEHFDPQIRKFKDYLKNDQFRGVFNESIPVILDQDDLNFMYHSVENRSPYLSKKILELAFNIPNKLKFKDGIAKYPLRKVVNKLVNFKILNNKRKVGFNTTINNIVNTKSSNFMKEILKSDFMKKNINKTLIENQIKYSPTLLNSQQLFNIYTTSKFINKFE